MIGAAVVGLLALLSAPWTTQSSGRETRLSVTGDHLSCSVVIPYGWRPFTSADGTRYLVPGAQRDEMGTSLYIRATPRQGKRATSLFAGDEIITTADSEKALVRYFRGGPFQSVIRESDLTPGAVAYIEEGDFFVVLVLTSTDAHFAEAKRVFKAVVGSYRKTGSNRR